VDRQAAVDTDRREISDDDQHRLYTATPTVHTQSPSSMESPVHILTLSIQAVRGLPRMRAPGIVLALSLSPGNSLVCSCQFPCFDSV